MNESMLDLQHMRPAVSEALGGREHLVEVWFSNMLHYSLVHTLSDHYADFSDIGKAALYMVGEMHGVIVDPEKAQQALSHLGSLPPHPDVPVALTLLKKAGFRCITLTNSSLAGIHSQVLHAGLQGYFEQTLSVEQVGYFKPHPHVYRWAAEQAGEAMVDCMLIAAHPWDIAGALWTGMPAAFLRRPGKAYYPLAPLPTMEGVDLLEVARQLMALE